MEKLLSFKKKTFVLFYSLCVFQSLYKTHRKIFEENQNVNIYLTLTHTFMLLQFYFYYYSIIFTTLKEERIALFPLQAHIIFCKCQFNFCFLHFL